MKWWTVWHGICVFRDDGELSRHYLYSISWMFAPAYAARYVQVQPPPPANDNGWWMGS